MIYWVFQKIHPNKQPIETDEDRENDKILSNGCTREIYDKYGYVKKFEENTLKENCIIN